MMAGAHLPKMACLPQHNAIDGGEIAPPGNALRMLETLVTRRLKNEKMCSAVRVGADSQNIE